MAANKIICHCKQVSYLDIRTAMVNGARTLDEIKNITGAATGCGRCREAAKEVVDDLLK